MSTYQISPDMVAEIRSIAGLKQGEQPCHKSFVCTGVICGIIDMSTRYLRELELKKIDDSGYGDQVIYMAVSLYKASLTNVDRSSCNVDGMKVRLLKLGELAYPQFLELDRD